MITFLVIFNLICMLIFIISVVFLIFALIKKKDKLTSLAVMALSFVLTCVGLNLYTRAVKSEAYEEQLDKNLSTESRGIKISDKKKSESSSNTTSDNSSKNNVQITGNATTAISAVKQQVPVAGKYIKSINTNSEYGLKVVTRGLKIKSQSDTQKTVGNLEAIMRVIHKADSTKGIGFIQKEASGDTMFAIYFKSNVITDNTAVGTEDFFDGATSFYVDGSVAGSNPVFSSRSLSKEGPVINSKTYVNMLMYD